MYAGQPVINTREKLGFIYEIEAANPNVSVFTSKGMQPAGPTVRIVWEDGTLSKGLDEYAVTPWIEAAAHLPARAPGELAPLVEAAKDAQEAAYEANRAALKVTEENRRAFVLDAASRIPEGAKTVIIAEHNIDQSDSMSDYHGHRTDKVLILGFSKHTRDLFPELRKAAANAEEVAHLAGELYDIRPVVAEEYRDDDGFCVYKGSLSRWHRDETPTEPFTSEAAARAYCEANPLNSVTMKGRECLYEWQINKRDFEHREKYSMGAGFYLKDGHRDATGWGIRKVSIGSAEGIPTGEWRLAAPKTPKTRTPRADYDTASAHFTQELGQDIEIREGTKPGYSEIVFAEKPDEETRDSLKAAGFRWSRFSKCWYGLTENIPAEYLEEATPQTEAYAIAAADWGTPSEGTRITDSPAVYCQQVGRATRPGAKLRALAGGMQKSIDSNLGDRLTNTPKRLAQANHSRMKGEREQRAQKALYAMADMLDAGTLPPILAGLKSKAAVLALVGTKTEPVQNGYHTYSACTGEPNNTTPEAVAVWQLLEDKTPEQKQAEELRRKIEGLQFTKIPGYFPTPPAVIEEVMSLADIREDHSVLEPSAGSAALLDAIPEAGTIHCCEINHTLREILHGKGYEVIGDDFMGLLPPGSYRPDDRVALAPCRYDRIVMNPPFENMQDADHVRHAYQFLKPGGRLVAIMSPSAFNNSSRKAEEFRDWFDRMGGERIDLPEGSFKASGTGVNTVLIVIDREG